MVFTIFRMKNVENESEEPDLIDRICSATLPLVTRGIRAGNSLPVAGENFEFYHSYPSFAVSHSI